ncbi:MAG TPA: hypothetical protein VMV18_03245, partial [bacterium]|nr:hypothetical protein [bacterium]
KIRLAVVASLVAILFGFVTIGHARTHAGDKTAEAACTFCQHATSVSEAPVEVAATQILVAVIAVLVSVIVSSPAARAHASRGPPRAV